MRLKQSQTALADKSCTTDNLLLILTLFICTYFVFRDFGIRMIYGYFIMLFLFALVLFKRVRSDERQSFSSINWMMILLAVVITLNYLRPDSRHDDDTMSYIIAMAIITLFVFFAKPTAREIDISYKIILITAFIFAVYVIIFSLKEELFWKTISPHLSVTAIDYLEYYVPRGYGITIGGVTYTNYILLLGIATAGGILLKSNGHKRKRLVCILLMVLFVFAIMITGRRGELIGAVAACAVVYVVSGNIKQRLIRVLIIAAIIIAGIVIIKNALPSLKKVDALHRYAMTIENALSGSDITSGRTELFQLAWSKFTENPLFGTGWGSFATFIPNSFRAVHGDVNDVHCIYLQFLCETGIVGTIFILTPLIHIFVKTVKVFVRECRKHRLDGNIKSEVSLTAITVSFLLQSFLLIMGAFDPCFQRLVFWCFYGIAVSLTIYAGKINKLFNDQTDERITNNSYNAKLEISEGKFRC